MGIATTLLQNIEQVLEATPLLLRGPFVPRGHLRAYLGGRKFQPSVGGSRDHMRYARRGFRLVCARGVTCSLVPLGHQSEHELPLPYPEYTDWLPTITVLEQRKGHARNQPTKESSANSRTTGS